MRAFTLVLVTVAFLFSFKTNAQQLISVDELAKISKENTTLIVSTRKASDYAKVHITGAVNMYHKNFYQTGDISGLLKDKAALEAMLGKAGITPDKTIVLYDAKSGKYSSRVFWILDYLGYPNVKILDGQLEAWKAKRKPVTSSPSKSKKAEITLTPNASKIATMAEVLAASKDNSAYIIDARKTLEFDGSEGKYEPRGHIPGAINVFFEDVVGKTGKFISKEKMDELLASKGISNDKPVIIYCNTGILASVIYVGVKYVSGYDNVKVYEGSIAEWVTVSSNPIEK